MNKNKPIAPTIDTRSFDALTAVTENGRGKTREHNPTPSTPIEKRRKDAYDRIIKNGRGTRSHGKREVQEQTKTDLRLIIGGLALSIALTGAALMSGGEDAPKTPDKAPTTTVVIAKEGDSIWKLQRDNEGFDGNDPRDVVSKAIGLNGTTTIIPGEPVVLIDYPDNNIPDTQP